MKWYAISPFLILYVALVAAILEDDMASLEKDLSKAELIDELEKEFASASKDAHAKIEKKYREKFNAIVKKKADAERLLNQDIRTLNQKNAHTTIEKKDLGQFHAIVEKKTDSERPLNQDISTLKQKNGDKLDLLQLLVNAIHDSKVKNDDDKDDILQLLDNAIHDSTVKNDEECEDKRTDCSDLKPFCKSEPKRLLNICAKTCGFCSPTCKDVWNKKICMERFKLGLCRGKSFVDRMKQNCASTCGYCKVPQQPKCSETKFGCCWDTSTIKKDDAGSNCRSCVDDYKYPHLCSRFKGDCMKDNDSGELVRKTCPKSCNLCGKGACLDDPKKAFYCPYWKDTLKLCEKRPETMKYSCPKTCGIC